MNIDQVIHFLEHQEIHAGKFARPHWRNAIREVGMAKHQSVEDRVDPRQQGPQAKVTPINRAKFAVRAHD